MNKLFKDLCKELGELWGATPEYCDQQGFHWGRIAPEGIECMVTLRPDGTLSVLTIEKGTNQFYFGEYSGSMGPALFAMTCKASVTMADVLWTGEAVH